MPPELWNDGSPIDVMQRHSRYVQASKLIDELEREGKELRDAIRNLRDVSGRHHTEQACLRLYALLPENS